MADPLSCLRAATICIGIWNIMYCLIQFGLLGWQFQVVKDIIAEYENRQLPATGAIDGFQARFPGLYQIYTETPERRRANAMYVIIIVCLIFAIANFLTSILLIYAAFKYLKTLIWPWFATAIPLCIMTTAYSVLWWSGDIFNAQLSMSIFEFVLSVAVNSITIVIVIVYFSRLTGSLVSTRPARPRRVRRKRRDPTNNKLYLEGVAPTPATILSPKPLGDVVPDWRREWPSVPDVQLQRKLSKLRREEARNAGFEVNPSSRLDFYAPQVDDVDFPWKSKTLRESLRERKETQTERIKRLYYQHWPEDLPNMPMEMRKRMQENRERVETQRNKSRLKGFQDI